MFDHFPNCKAAALIAALAVPAVSISTAALAEENPVVVQAEPLTVKSERVSFASLDLSQVKGRKALNFRIAGAIERVCEKDIGRDGLQANEYYRCETGAWGRAQPQIDRAVNEAQSIALNGGDATLVTGAIMVSAG